jgi:hypothetical protein
MITADDGIFVLNGTETEILTIDPALQLWAIFAWIYLGVKFFCWEFYVFEILYVNFKPQFLFVWILYVKIFTHIFYISENLMCFFRVIDFMCSKIF